MFKILGNGMFAQAMNAMITQAGGFVSDMDFNWIIPCIPSYALKTIELEPDKKYIFISKGLVEKGVSGQLVTEWARENNLKHVFLSGPHLASEIIHNLPTTTTIAGEIADYAELSRYFDRPSHSNSVDFICLAGVIKNIVAYACGMCLANDLGENFKAGLITQGVRELKLIAETLNIDYVESDILQPGVLSDMVLTGNSVKSRNFLAGYNAYTSAHSTELVTESIHSAPLLIERISPNAQWPIACMVHSKVCGEVVDITKYIK